MINQLYGTNLYAVGRMAKHISRIMRHHPPKPGPKLVGKIALLQSLDEGGISRHFSFASKFCHRFVDKEACPIMDRLAIETIRLHLGSRAARDAENPYRAFVRDRQRLLDETGVLATATELDNYLWIRGGYERWRKRSDTPLNGELKEFFWTNRRRRLLRRLIAEE